MSEGLRLVIVQPYVPKYRVDFFERLIERLAYQGIDCLVAAAEPTGEQKARSDAVTPSWVRTVPNRTVGFAGRTLTLGGSRSIWKNADGIVVGHLGSSLDTYGALLKGKFGKAKVGLWGHIKSYVQGANPLDAALERWQLRNADHVFAYTPGGAAYAVQHGVLEERVTTVMNSINSEALESSFAAVKPSAVEGLRERFGLVPGRTLAFIGGLDESKRISFLAAALDLLWDSDPDVRVLVAGRGSQDHLLNAAEARGQAVMLGYADTPLQALIGATSEAILMPGRIGLIAVEALVLRRPIITTDWPYHAPESEYLVEGQSRITTPDDPFAYAAAVSNYLRSKACISDPCASEHGWRYPTLTGMVDNFAEGVLKMMKS